MHYRPTSHALRVLLVAICLPLGAGVAADRGARQDSSRDDAQRNPRQLDPARSDLPSQAPAGADYLLQPQDVLRVHVFQHEDLNKQSESVTISNDYTIYLPLIQTVNLKGKTRREAEDIIRAAYDKDYLVNPQVSINVIKYAERAVNIAGQVNKPGRIQFPQERGLTIIEALAEAGGPTRLADLKKVKLTRKNADGDTVIEEINVDAMWNKASKEARDATPLQKDDVIYIPERII